MVLLFLWIAVYPMVSDIQLLNNQELNFTVSSDVTRERHGARETAQGLGCILVISRQKSACILTVWMLY